MQKPERLKSWKTFKFYQNYYSRWRKITDLIKKGGNDSEEWRYYQNHKDDSREDLSETLDLMEKNLKFYPHFKWLNQCTLKHVVSDFILRERGGLDDPQWYSEWNNGEDLKPEIPDPDDKKDHL